MTLHVLDDPSALSPRARRFIREKGRREDVLTAEELREHWRSWGRSGPLIDKMVDYQARWGGLALPELAVPLYDGGVAVMYGEDLGELEEASWCFGAGMDHYSVAHWFCVDPQGRFGILYEHWVALHSSVSGWIEACALADAAQAMERIGTWRGEEARRARILTHVLPGLTPVPEVEGLADNWWQDNGVLFAAYDGEARVFRSERSAFTALYAESEHQAEELKALLCDLGL
ncbi:hypothetical protein [Planomonospora venezuelensis]|uniref:Uncharacterized protein n=1 Tax=Planomonospora venezuelensis TaxID=1999 RepID=A0A841DCU4_PLAVE|nr:hypothetical protein [Planomonospora venezuelensis]MBB5966613.1 hypothetical protein [Planomonospora venezuelensis]GIN03534.1 hypothetical protein Pve01_51920 [Planomonospora venezuelensis]